ITHHHHHHHYHHLSKSFYPLIHFPLTLFPLDNFINTMGAGKNKSHRKKRISKHVLQAEERRKLTEAEGKLLSAADTGSSSALPSSHASTTTPVDDEIASSSKDGNLKEKPSKKNKTAVESKTKDPEEAASYLTLWNYDRNNNNGKNNGNTGNHTWKFNKNTQSWLLRHMYDSEKVSKATFGILVDYICQGGEGTCCRVEEDAKMRARRYKEWEKRVEERNDTVEHDGQTTGDSNQGGDKREDDANDKKLAEEKMEDVSAWNQLSDHDKRKVYKRARKVLDALKAKKGLETKTENEG
ncbi:hypothetical protein ACHAXS_003515, partial [Conticribra weissflogii]